MTLPKTFPPDPVMIRCHGPVAVTMCST